MTQAFARWCSLRPGLTDCGPLGLRHRQRAGAREGEGLGVGRGLGTGARLRVGLAGPNPARAPNLNRLPNRTLAPTLSLLPRNATEGVPYRATSRTRNKKPLPGMATWQGFYQFNLVVAGRCDRSDRTGKRPLICRLVFLLVGRAHLRELVPAYRERAL